MDSRVVHGPAILDNTGLSELRRYPDGWVLHRLNDTGHL
jgi:hypothetical protein